jgi:hypothetical protein
MSLLSKFWPAIIEVAMAKARVGWDFTMYLQI